MKEQRIQLLSLVAALTMAILISFSAQALARETLSIKSLQGEVSLSEDGETWIPAEPGAEFLIAEGGYIKTGPNSQALVRWTRGHAVKVFDNANIKIEKLLAKGNVEESLLNVSRGKMFATVNRLMSSESRFDVKTPVAVAGVRGTGYYLAVGDKGETTIIMQEGSLDIMHSDKTYSLDEEKGAIIESKDKAPESFDPSEDTRNALDDIAAEIKEITSSRSENSPIQVDDIINDILTEIDEEDTVIDLPEPEPDLPPIPPDLF